MNISAIGVFDSGIGGLTCVKEINRLMPNEDVIYFGDTARIPYGTRSRETVLRYARQDMAFIKKFDVKIIISACGTVSSVSLNEKNFAGEDCLYTGVVIPAAGAAAAATRNKRIGVIGTQATVKSNAYAKVLKTINQDIKVFGQSCPMFVPLVENGYVERGNKVSTIIAEQYLKQIKNEGVDVLILGCTHYPLLTDIIADFMGNDVTLISSGKEAANTAHAILTKSNLLTSNEKRGTNRYFVSDGVESFSENAALFLGENAEDCTPELINIDEFLAE
ncbi:MAG: glutamate racemase [Ruminococcus sp.]|nr:glutamate racemase [Ruminococcus sp.]